MKKILSILFLMVMTVSLFSQTTLTFEGKDRTGQDYVQLSRVSVFDLDQLWHLLHQIQRINLPFMSRKRRNAYQWPAISQSLYFLDSIFVGRFLAVMRQGK